MIYDHEYCRRCRGSCCLERADMYLAENNETDRMYDKQVEVWL